MSIQILCPFFNSVVVVMAFNGRIAISYLTRSIFLDIYCNTLKMRLLWQTQAPFCAPPNCGLDHTPVLLGCLCTANSSPLAGSVCWSQSFRTQPLHAQQMHISGWGVQQGGQDHLCWFCLLQRLLNSPLSLWSSLSLPADLSAVKGVPRVRESFSLTAPSQGHRSHPDSFFFFCPTWLLGDLSCSFGCMRSSGVQWVFCENYVTCRCIFGVLVGEGELHVLLFHILSLLQVICIWKHYFSHLSCACWPSICMSSLEKCLFTYSAHFLISIFLLLSRKSSLCYWHINPLLDIWFAIFCKDVNGYDLE